MTTAVIGGVCGVTMALWRSVTVSIHEFDPDRRPDDGFEPGRLDHLVLGGAGRRLDARRTPVRIVELCDRTGQFTVEILAFEDEGARWTLPYEDVGGFQFEKGQAVCEAGRVREIEAIVERLGQTMAIECDPGVRGETERLLEAEVRRIRRWLRGSSRLLGEGGVLPDPQRREGDPRLAEDFERFMRERGLWELEDAFAATFVSAPFGELIRGHRMVIAELGLVRYEGGIARDERMFDEPWSRARRGKHIIARLGFLRALGAELGIGEVTLFRGISSEGQLRREAGATFVSATFCEAVAESLYAANAGEGSAGMLCRQSVGVERLFMTYHETAAMNRQFKEAEAVLLADRGNPLF